MQPIEGMARAQWEEKASSVRSAAQSARQKSIELRAVERLVVQEIEAWQRDNDAAHLLRAISALQGGMSISAGLTSASAGAAAQVSGVCNSWQPEPPGHSPFAGAATSLAGAAQDRVDRAAEEVKRTVRSGFSNIEDKVQKAAKLLEGVADAARKGGLGVPVGAQGGFGGRAAGSIPGAAGGGVTQQAGLGHAGTQGGFGGRASGTIPRR